jgi:hypothetical protein
MYNFNKHHPSDTMHNTDSMNTPHSYRTRLSNLENDLKGKGSAMPFDLAKLES